MRDIKVRVWYDSENKYYYFSLKDYMLSNETRQSELCPSYVGLEFEQFTGLRDKNGKEIYEGDILRFPDNISFGKEGIHCLAVTWNNIDGCWFPMIEIIKNYNYYGERIVNFWMQEKPYIIGNIHGNPELLK